MSNDRSSVYIVDDDPAVRDSLRMLVKSYGMTAILFESGDQFVEAYRADWNGCILLDIRMPGMNGMEVQQQLANRNCSLPIIFISGHGDIPLAVEAMRSGAFDFIQKPFSDQELLDRIEQALAVYASQEAESAMRQDAQAQYETLTPREKEVMTLVAQGAANKVIAQDLDVSQRTVEIHRARVMEKMKARSLAALVRKVITLDQ